MENGKWKITLHFLILLGAPRDHLRAGFSTPKKASFQGGVNWHIHHTRHAVRHNKRLEMTGCQISRNDSINLNLEFEPCYKGAAKSTFTHGVKKVSNAIFFLSTSLFDRVASNLLFKSSQCLCIKRFLRNRFSTLSTMYHYPSANPSLPCHCKPRWPQWFMV